MDGDNYSRGLIATIVAIVAIVSEASAAEDDHAHPQTIGEGEVYVVMQKLTAIRPPAATEIGNERTATLVETDVTENRGIATENGNGTVVLDERCDEMRIGNYSATRTTLGLVVAVENEKEILTEIAIGGGVPLRLPRREELPQISPM
ncbi:hypothetical protein CMQ_3068 [Grosmannia clavigera kw1407]|uniref:Uncharacterized protein n=1 Tax=Grosmannia clavigera (strain kw1407 / UAMH 11150) TaxID=655863 RepID=F0XHI3_GROCL|nr:uncharacterized protein CMQ_3068 [Grosmannia clavigera kw1407]EFX03139.1 hypothetical protein CMQ_3068 [Grosmannia clavigera kw1407]